MKIAEASFQTSFNIMEVLLYIGMLNHHNQEDPLINPSLFSRFKKRINELFDITEHGDIPNYYHVAKNISQLTIKTEQHTNFKYAIIQLLTDIKFLATQLKEDVDDLMEEIIFKDQNNKQQLGNVFNYHRKSRQRGIYI